MKTDINELITLSYELEGLLLLAMHKGDDTPEQVWRLIDDHLKSLSDGISDRLPVAHVSVSADIYPDKSENSHVEAEEHIVEEQAQLEDLHELKLDEKLARDNSRCLRKAFSLNDRFRFRRELFGNSDVVMTDTLDLVEAMRSYDEAFDYFFDELGWDRDNPEVIDFMDIINKHFQSR